MLPPVTTLGSEAKAAGDGRSAIAISFILSPAPREINRPRQWRRYDTTGQRRVCARGRPPEQCAHRNSRPRASSSDAGQPFASGIMTPGASGLWVARVRGRVTGYRVLPGREARVYTFCGLGCTHGPRYGRANRRLASSSPITRPCCGSHARVRPVRIDRLASMQLVVEI